MLEICNNGSDQQRNLAYIEESTNLFSWSSVTRDRSDLGQTIGDYSDRGSSFVCQSRNVERVRFWPLSSKLIYVLKSHEKWC